MVTGLSLWLIPLFQMAIVGTTLNTVIVALGLYIFNEFAWDLPGANIFHALTFSAIISGILRYCK